MNENHPRDFIPVKYGPASPLNSVHLVVAVPCELNTRFGVTNAGAVVDGPSTYPNWNDPESFGPNSK